MKESRAASSVSETLLVVGYHIGNRKGVLLDLKWPKVELRESVIRFMRMQNRKPVPVAAPIYGDMEHWLRTTEGVSPMNTSPSAEFVFFWFPDRL